MTDSTPAVVEVPAAQVRRQLTELIAKAGEGQVVVIRVGGLPVATLMPVRSVAEAVELHSKR